MAINLHIHLDIDGEPTAREAAILNALGTGSPAAISAENLKVGDFTPTAEPTPKDKPKRTRRTKEQIKADKEADSTPEADSAPAAETTPEEPEKDAPAAEETPAASDPAEMRGKARKAAVAFLNDKGRDELEEVLSKFDAKRIPDVADDKLEDFISALEA